MVWGLVHQKASFAVVQARSCNRKTQCWISSEGSLRQPHPNIIHFIYTLAHFLTLALPRMWTTSESTSQTMARRWEPLLALTVNPGRVQSYRFRLVYVALCDTGSCSIRLLGEPHGLQEKVLGEGPSPITSSNPGRLSLGWFIRLGQMVVREPSPTGFKTFLELYFWPCLLSDVNHKSIIRVNNKKLLFGFIVAILKCGQDHKIRCAILFCVSSCSSVFGSVFIYSCIYIFI